MLNSHYIIHNRQLTFRQVVSLSHLVHCLTQMPAAYTYSDTSFGEYVQAILV